jgi:non-homologous end joining protein Ku
LRDRRQEELRDLINKKAEGLPTKAVPAARRESAVVDLMAALKQSLAQEGGTVAKPRRKVTENRRQHSIPLIVSRPKKASWAMAPSFGRLQ